MDQDQRYQQVMNQGHSAAWEQEWDRAAALYGQALEAKPDDPKALTSLALAFLNMGELEKSLRYYLRAAEVSPTDPVPLEKAATIYENMGQPQRASKLSERAAELYLKEKNADKAIENWSRAVSLNPENLQAHTRLAVVYERIERKPQAVREYLHMSSLFQHAGQQEKAFESINRAMQVDPANQEVRQALAMLRAGTLLPKPARPQGGTGPFGKTNIPPASSPKPKAEAQESGLNPIDEARQEAMASLARLFFEQSSEEESSEEPSTRRGLQAIVSGASPVFSKNADRAKIMLHLGQAVEMLTSGGTDQAAEELKGAIAAGLDAPAAYFNLGVIQADSDRLESAVRHLQKALPHVDFSLGSRLILGDIWYRRGKFSKAALRYLEALRSADAQVVAPHHADDLRELYDPLMESFSRDKDESRQKKLCENVHELLVRPNWRSHLMNARRQLGEQDSNDMPTPLAEILLESSSSDIVMAMSNVRSLARAGQLGAALEEILFALQRAPTYLPLHIVLGDLLVSKDRLAEASQKFSVVARAYSIRGESSRAISMLRRVVDMVPMDLEPRRQLIDHLVNWGQIDEAIDAYLKLAEVHYSMAEIAETRQAYSSALQLAQQSLNYEDWQVRILHRTADIETQSLNWRQAARLYRQICALRPDDGEAYRGQIGLLFNLNESEQALVAIDQYTTHMAEIGATGDAIALLEELTQEQPNQAMIHYRLAAQCQKVGRTDSAIQHYDAAGELLLEAGDKAGAGEMIRRIVQLDPPDKEKYQRLLDTI